MSFRLVSKPPTYIAGGMKRLKWAIHDEAGRVETSGGWYVEIVNMVQGFRRSRWVYRETEEEAAMLEQLKRQFKGYDVVSIPNPHDPETALFEARKDVPGLVPAKGEATSSKKGSDERKVESNGSLFL